MIQLYALDVRRRRWPCQVENGLAISLAGSVSFAVPLHVAWTGDADQQWMAESLAAQLLRRGYDEVLVMEE
jgi:hypothetical protein